MKTIERLKEKKRIANDRRLVKQQKVESNKKSTKGRKIYYQTIIDKDGNRKTIKHRRESVNRLNNGINLIKMGEGMNKPKKESTNENTIEKKNHKRRLKGFIFHDSFNKGTFIRSEPRRFEKETSNLS